MERRWIRMSSKQTTLFLVTYTIISSNRGSGVPKETTSLVGHLAALLSLSFGRGEDGGEVIGIYLLRLWVHDLGRLGQHRARRHGLRLLLRVLVLGKGPDRIDLSPLLADLDRLGSRLEQVQGLARLLCMVKLRIIDRYEINLLDRYGIALSCSSQYSEILMASL